MFKRIIRQKYIIVIILVIAVAALSSCRAEPEQQDDVNDYDKQIEELNDKIGALESDLEEANSKLEVNKKKDDNFVWVSNLSLEFVRAHTQGNKEKMRELLSEEIELVEKNNKIYGIKKEGDKDIELILYEKNNQYPYMDMVIQGYGYIEEEDAFLVHIREFYEDKTPPTFLNLTIKKFDDTWKIIDFEFDV